MLGTATALYIFILLMPGFISNAIVELIATIKPKNDFKRVIDAAIHASVNLFIFFFITNVWHSTTLQMIKLSNLGKEGDILVIQGVDALSILVLIVISVITGILWGISINKDFPWRLLRKWGITIKSSRLDLWNDVLSQEGGMWARIFKEDGTIIVGYVKFFSQTESIKQLYLKDVSIYFYIERKKGWEKIFSEETLYISIDERVKFVSFYCDITENRRY